MKQARDYRKYKVRLTSADWQRGSGRVVNTMIWPLIDHNRFIYYDMAHLLTCNHNFNYICHLRCMWKIARMIKFTNVLIFRIIPIL